MSLDTTQLKAIYAFAMGYGTEVLPGKNPYQLVQSTGNSGWSMGVIQYDFGQRGLDGVLVDFVNTWAASVNRSGLSVSRDAAIAILNSKGTSIQNFSSADQKLINEWAAANSNVFYQNFERLVVEENVPKVAAAINNDRFISLPEADQMRIVMMLSKAINQGGNGGFLDAQAILNGLSDSKYNADGFAEAIRLATNTTYQLDSNYDLRKGIAQADLVGKTLALVSNTPGLKSLLSEAYNTTSFDTGTVSRSGGLAFFSTLLQNAKDPSRAAEFSRFLSNLSNPSDKGAYFNNGNTVIGVTSDGALFLVDSKTLSGSYSKLGLWEPINNGVSKFDNVTIIQRNKNGKPAFIVAGLDGEEAGFLISEGTITSLSKPESQAALLAATLDGLNGDVLALDRSEAANLVNGMMTQVPVVDAMQLAINADLVAMRNAILYDPDIQIAANGDVSTITTQGTIYAITSDGQTLRALTDNGVLIGYDFLTGRDAGKTVSWTVEGTLSDTQLAALGGTMATALAPGLETGAITAIPLDEFNGTITATLTQKGTGEVLSSVQISTLRDGSGTPVGTLRVETRKESGALITTETRQYTSGQQAATLTTVTSDNLQGQTVQAQFVNGQFNGITQVNGAAVSDGLQKLFAGILSENGVDGAPTTQDIARLGQDLDGGATSRDTAFRAALEAVTGEAVAGTDYFGNPTLI